LFSAKNIVVFPFITQIQEEALEMAASAQQGTYLGTTLLGFTAYVAGRVAGGGVGILIALVGVVLLVLSAAGFYKIKSIG
jgi:hypothetical protein